MPAARPRPLTRSTAETTAPRSPKRSAKAGSASGRLVTGAPPLATNIGATADPLPQALVLTAIVIGFGMTAFVVILALRALGELGTDQVDGEDEKP